jgi:hypothetical protein
MSTEITEELILDALHKVPQDKWDRVLKFLHNLEPKTAHAPEGAEHQCWTAAELLALPPAERSAILAEAAALAVNDYRNDRDSTDLEALGVDDLYGDDTEAPTR